MNSLAEHGIDRIIVSSHNTMVATPAVGTRYLLILRVTVAKHLHVVEMAEAEKNTIDVAVVSIQGPSSASMLYFLRFNSS